MLEQLIEKTKSISEQRFVLPGRYSWQQFKAIQALMNEIPGVKLTYLDGVIEFMTTGEEHETIKKLLAILLETYFFEKGIRFIPVGNATREAEVKGASFQPDESYYMGSTKTHPILAIEIVITSGGKDKLEKYKRFKISEVWFWENSQISVYVWQDSDYEKFPQSRLLPDLDMSLLASCVRMLDVFAARTVFLNAIRQGLKI